MNRRDAYFSELGIDPSKDEKKLEAALKRAYEQRSFEIEHLWKRATFFWGFQLGVFTAFGFVWSHAKAEGGYLLLFVLAGVGVLTAASNIAAAQGSKFWQRNWENHIDMLEDALEGRLYKTVWLDRGEVSFSVSEVSERLNYSFVFFWLVAGAYVACRFLGLDVHSLDTYSLRYFVIFLGVIAVLIGLWFIRKRTRITGVKVIFGNAVNWSRWRSDRGLRCSSDQDPLIAFVVRDAPTERSK
ncbi:hypothetical protein RPPS3_16570 [Rhodopseudomonas palustris]|uniref:RipA family octameric membrane protein n=1 Tax=Rhodopseudomonas palustris TaxID=1076 RepID=UPI000D214271|nr:hypothetical protein [Rhodopseudomonas palustris]AVT75720.1 hypothetical protein RPPS3_16570 [Rhodopseudomonas palustris]